MKDLLILLALLAISAPIFGYKKAMLLSNRTPKIFNGRPSDVSRTCSECKMVVARFAKSLEDPEKIKVLKVILRALCYKTSIPSECVRIVDEIDILVHSLKPYLDDPEKICKEIHMCGNGRLELFRKITVLYGFISIPESTTLKNEMVCDECVFAVGELREYIENPGSLEKAKEFLMQEFCDRLGKYSGSCAEVVEQFLPELFEELDKLLIEPKKLCADMGLCADTTPSTDDSLKSNEDEKQVSIFTQLHI